jgi:lysophospholipase L1-like esterase
MIVDASRIRVLCFGDSNTWGRDPNSSQRLTIDKRWPGVLQQLLGDGYDVIEEGLGGRTVNLDDKSKPGKNGQSYLTPCIESHVPINILILMLGTNDLKSQFDTTPETITNGLSQLIDDINEIFDKNGDKNPRIIVISPVHINSENQVFKKVYGHAFDESCGVRSKELSPLIRKMCEDCNIEFLDAQDYAHAGDDGLHLAADSHKALAVKLAEVIRK